MAARVLGGAGQDNALFLQIDSGQAVERLLFDCGEDCLSALPFSEIQGIDHLFFSHFHMDHVSGFDSFFRATFNRETKPMHVWGPPETVRIMQHRFCGFLWNLHEQMSATWRVSEIGPDSIRTARFELQEAFAVLHDEGEQLRKPVIWEGAGYTVEAITMDHRTPTMAYVVREKPRENIDISRVAALGLRPGPWMKQLRDSALSDDALLIDGTPYSAAELRRQLMVETPGDSMAYLTDFWLDEAAMDALAARLQGCRVILCEGQYRHADLELARKNFHMTTALSATLARRARVDELILFHLSSRYTRADWLEMRREAREIFPNTHYPPAWALDEGAQLQ